MLGYVTLGTNDLARAARFYDAVATAMGCSRIMDNDNFIAWGPADGGPGLALTLPESGARAEPGHGTTVALVAQDRADVDRLHALAIGAGGSGADAPTERFTGFYAAYVLDPDGNRIGFFVIG